MRIMDLLYARAHNNEIIIKSLFALDEVDGGAIVLISGQQEHPS